MRNLFAVLWLILIVIALIYALPYLLIIGFVVYLIYKFYLKKRFTVYTSKTFFDEEKNYEQNNINDDVIDVEYTEKKE